MLPRLCRCYTPRVMTDRSAALINWGRCYHAEGIERELPFPEAEREYRRLLESGAADTVLALHGAEFFFFTMRFSLLGELESALLHPGVRTSNTYAYCAYAQAAMGNHTRAIELIREAHELYPEQELLFSDLLRLQSVTGRLAEPFREVAGGEDLDSYHVLEESIYLLIFLFDQGLITVLPAETEPALELLETYAESEGDLLAASLTRADVLSALGRREEEQAVLTEALKRWSSEYELQIRLAALGLDEVADQQEIERAIGHAERAAALRPWFPGGFHLMGILLSKAAEEEIQAGREEQAAERLNGAIEAFHRCRRIDSRNKEYIEELLYLYGTLFALVDPPDENQPNLHIEGKVDQLIEELRLLSAEDAAYLAALGRNLFESGLEPQGQILVTRAEEIDRRDPAVLHARGLFSFTRAIRGGENQQAEFETAADLFEQAYHGATLPEQKARYLVTMASVLRQMQDGERELAALLEGAESGLPDEEIYLTISELYHNLGLFPKAVAALERGTKVMPESSELGIELARCYSRDGAFQKAGEKIDSLLSLYPNSPWIWNQAGIISVEQGNSIEDDPAAQAAFFERAVHAYDQARRLAPEEFTYLGNFGDALRLTGDLDRGETYLKNALRINPEDIFSLNSLGLLYGDRAKQTAERELREQYLSEAEHYLQRAASLSPGDTTFDVNLADLYYDLGYFEDTIDIYQRIIETDEDAWQYYDIIGLCYYHTGNLLEAAHWFRGAIDKEPGAPEVVNSLGLCYFGSGKIDEAIEYFKQASLLDPENPVYLDNIVMAQYNREGYQADFGDGPRM